MKQKENVSLSRKMNTGNNRIKTKIGTVAILQHAELRHEDVRGLTDTMYIAKATNMAHAYKNRKPG
jgi:hypothetical protein